MFKHEIAYTDFNGIDRKEEFHFHLSLPELTRLEAEIGTSLEEHTKALVSRRDPEELIKFLEKVILMSYGKKSLDGRSFQKNADIRSEFEYSQAYAEFFEQLLTDTTLAQQFGSEVAETAKHKKNKVDPKIVQ